MYNNTLIELWLYVEFRDPFSFGTFALKVHTGLSNCLVTSGYTLVTQTANTAPKQRRTMITNDDDKQRRRRTTTTMDGDRRREVESMGSEIYQWKIN